MGNDITENGQKNDTRVGDRFRDCRSENLLWPRFFLGMSTLRSNRIK